MNWTALYAILKNSINTTKAELEQEITEKIGLTNQFLDELPEVGESGVLYFIPKDDADPSAEDQYFMYVWDPDNTEFVLLDPDMDMSPYAKIADLANVATSGAYSDLSGTPDLTPYITEEEADEKYMSGDVLDDETVTGNPVTFESLDGGHAKTCEVEFGPIQSGSGDPSPSNIRPISGWDSLNLNQAGVNLANPTVYKQGYVLGSDGSESAQANYCITDKCIITAGKDYILRFKENPGTLSDNAIRIGFYKKDGTFIIRSVRTNATTYFTAPSDTAYCVLSYNNTPSSDNYKWDIMLNEGQTALDYIPYQGQNHTTTFPNTEYGGKVVWKDGAVKAVIDRAIVDLGSLDWDYRSGEQQKFFDSSPVTGMKSLLYDSDLSKFDSDIFVTKNPNVGWGNMSNCSFGVLNTRFRIRWEDYTDYTLFKNAVNNHYIVYELETPTEITLTPETIELLKGQNVLWTDGDNIELTAAQLELVKVIANPSGQATGTLNKIQINNDILNIPTELPVVASTDEGKVLTVNSSGEWEAADIPAQVEANPTDTATIDLTKLGVGGTVYGIPAAPTIVANPSGAATDILDKLQVGSTVYATPKQLDYSTAEQKTGVKWIDGRDIYQRTFVKTLAYLPDADSSSFLIASGLDTIDVLIDISGTVKGNGVHAFCGTTGLINANGWKYSIHLDSDNQLVVWTGSSSDYYNEIAGGKAFITIKYVKNLVDISNGFPIGTGFGIGNFEWDPQFTQDILDDIITNRTGTGTAASRWQSGGYWWLKFVSSNNDGSINIEAQDAWKDEPTASHFDFNKYYATEFYLDTDTTITYNGWERFMYTVAQDGTLTYNGYTVDRSYGNTINMRNTDPYLVEADNKIYIKMNQEIANYIIDFNELTIGNALNEPWEHNIIKTPLWIK